MESTVVIGGEIELINQTAGDCELIVDGSDSEEIILVNGNASLEVQSDGDCNLTTITDGVGETVYTTGTSDAEYYDGEYTVTPKAHSQTVLATSGKLMSQNVTVLKVPYYETSNSSGYTVYIASEV